MSLKSPQERLSFRRKRNRRSVLGTAERPRLSVRRSQKHMLVQLIDDVNGRTLASASSHGDMAKSGATVAAATRALTGMVITQAQTIRLARPERTAWTRRADPTPTIPSQQSVARARAAASSASTRVAAIEAEYAAAAAAFVAL